MVRLVGLESFDPTTTNHLILNLELCQNQGAVEGHKACHESILRGRRFLQYPAVTPSWMAWPVTQWCFYYCLYCQPRPISQFFLSWNSKNSILCLPVGLSQSWFHLSFQFHLQPFILSQARIHPYQTPGSKRCNLLQAGSRVEIPSEVKQLLDLGCQFTGTSRWKQRVMKITRCKDTISLSLYRYLSKTYIHNEKHMCIHGLTHSTLEESAP